MSAYAQHVYIGTLLWVAVCLGYGHRTGKVNLWDCVRSTDRHGVERTDPRKLFEAGAFVVMTLGFAFLVLADKLTEVYAALYVGAWVAARSLRDREQRLNRMLEAKP